MHRGLANQYRICIYYSTFMLNRSPQNRFYSLYQAGFRLQRFVQGLFKSSSLSYYCARSYGHPKPSAVKKLGFRV